LNIEPKNVKEFSDSIIITLSYKDGDGDLGNKDPDKRQLSVRDARLVKADFYHIAPLAPIGQNIPIDGTLRVKIKNTFLLGAGGDENTFYELRITDRAGNTSNFIKTDPITISR